MGTSPYGRPIEDYLVDPPINISHWNLPARGVSMVPRQDKQTGETVYHLIDVVGRKHYPNVADFIEEARQHGVSIRVQSTLDFSLLDPYKSRLLLAHPKGIIKHLEDYLEWKCPKGHQHHQPHQYDPNDPNRMCAGGYWVDIEGGEAATEDVDSRRIIRQLPSTTYFGYKRPAAAAQRYSKWYDRYERGIFMSLPIPSFVVINSQSEKFGKNLEKVKRGRIAVSAVDK